LHVYWYAMTHARQNGTVRFAVQNREGSSNVNNPRSGIHRFDHAGSVGGTAYFDATEGQCPSNICVYKRGTIQM
jgi:hypothetical protein